MTFQTKDFASIVASEINHARSVTQKITDFLPGSVARTLLEAPAVEIEELYLQMFLGLREAIPVSTFLSFGFEGLPATVARGFVTIVITNPRLLAYTVPLGTEFRKGALPYFSTADVVWPAGVTSVTVPVACSVAGTVGNAGNGQINYSPFYTDGYSISNPAIENGRDAETLSERETRFSEYIASLSRGTVAACLYAVGTARLINDAGEIVEFVTRKGILEEPGWVRIWVRSNAGPPSTALITEAQKIIDGWRDDELGIIVPGYRSAGVKVDVLPMAERLVPLSIAVNMITGYELTLAVRQSLSNIFASSLRAVQPGESLAMGTMIERMLDAEGIYSIVPGTSSNFVCGSNEALGPGTLTITEL